MNGQTKYDYPPQPSQVTGDFLIMKNFFYLSSFITWKYGAKIRFFREEM